jgi:hypothetical protein
MADVIFFFKFTQWLTALPLCLVFVLNNALYAADTGYAFGAANCMGIFHNTPITIGRRRQAPEITFIRHELLYAAKRTGCAPAETAPDDVMRAPAPSGKYCRRKWAAGAQSLEHNRVSCFLVRRP